MENRNTPRSAETPEEIGQKDGQRMMIAVLIRQLITLVAQGNIQLNPSILPPGVRQLVLDVKESDDPRYLQANADIKRQISHIPQTAIEDIADALIDLMQSGRNIGEIQAAVFEALLVVLHDMKQKQDTNKTGVEHRAREPKTPQQMAEGILRKIRRGQIELRAGESQEVLIELARQLQDARDNGVLSDELYIQATYQWGLAKFGAKVKRKKEEADHNLNHDTLAPEIFSKRAMPNEVARALEKCETQTGTLVYMDLNGFKEMNDRRGHAMGDLAIKAIGGALAAAGILIGRVGGDEFVCFFPGRTESEACCRDIARIFDTVMAQVQDSSPDTQPHFLKLHASMGAVIVDLREYSSSLEAATQGEHAADKLMNIAKKRKFSLRFPYALGERWSDVRSGMSDDTRVIVGAAIDVWHALRKKFIPGR